MTQIQFCAAGATHRGLVRAANEDSLLVTDRLVAVADGLGGHAAGEVASGIAVDAMRALADSGEIDDERVAAAIAAANRSILQAAQASLGRAGMATTLCGVGLGTSAASEQAQPQCIVFNVGDSRVYRFLDSELVQVSVDHSEVQQLRAAGQLSSDEAARYPRRNVITRCLGGDASSVPDLWSFPVIGRERFLVCSDGLTTEVDDEVLAGLLARHEDPRDAAEALVERALAEGGRDNVTVVVSDLVSGAG